MKTQREITGFFQSQHFKALCQQYRVASCYAFGSFVRQELTPKSDIDLVVSFKPMDVLDYADNYFDFKDELVQALERNIDLLEAKALKNPILKKRIHQTQKLIYKDE